MIIVALYLSFIANSVRSAFIMLGLIGVIAFGTLFICSFFRSSYNVHVEKVYKKYKKVFRNLFIVSLMSLFIGCIIPNTKNMLIICGVSTFMRSEHFENANAITKKTLKLLEYKIDDYLQEKN